DYDGDGRLDLAATAYLGGAFVFKGSDNGKFSVQPGLAISATCHDALAAADLNGDGLGDLIMGCGLGISRGDGTFEAKSLRFHYSPLAVADLNGDGAPDLAFRQPGVLFLLAGLGDGQFQPPRLYGPLPPARYFSGSSLLARDLDGDGHADLIAPGAGSPSLFLVWGKAAGFPGTPLLEISDLGPAKTLTIGDLDEDGLPDFLIPLSEQPRIRTYLHPGAAGGQNGPNIDSGNAYSALVAVDLDGEGWLDLAGTKYTGGLALVTFLGQTGRVKSHA